MAIGKLRSTKIAAVRFSIWLPALVVVAAVVAYIVFSAVEYGIGFPLDDAWIHQTYARNLAQHHEWAFILGQPSAGSTAPLWSFLLAMGHLFSTDVPYLWTFTLGVMFLALVALFGERLANGFFPEWKPQLPAAGLFLALEWHLVWAAGSGMETVLMAACILGVFVLLLNGERFAFWAGAITGLTAWVRPDGITLLGPIFFCLVLGGGSIREKAIAICKAAGGFLFLFVPYLIFNQLLAGSWWPNTFYAKQAEYAVLRSQPFLARLCSIASLPMIGAGALLVPGFVYHAFDAIRRRDWLPLAAILWWIGYSALYALLLPVTYQHGRYLIPAMPVFFVLGLVGTGRLIRAYLLGRQGWMLRTTWVIAIAAVSIIFLGAGAKSYGMDVAVIETEMVKTARWLAQQTQPDDRIAVHDIGAVGYFSGRDQLVDLAGLVTPEVIPFIRDEVQIIDYLNQQQVDYLVAFPDWYLTLVEVGEPVFTSGGMYAPSMGHANMTIYRWPSQLDEVR